MTGRSGSLSCVSVTGRRRRSVPSMASMWRTFGTLCSVFRVLGSSGMIIQIEVDERLWRRLLLDGPPTLSCIR